MNASATKAKIAAKWPGFDYNIAAELCQACGCAVLRSGSRYSVWFCSECKKRAGTLDTATGPRLIPIGPHTIMHGIALPANPEPTDAAIDVFFNRIRAFTARVDRLRSWSHAVVRSNLETLHLASAPTVLLADYLEAANSLDRGERFDAMVESMQRGEHEP